MILFRAKSYPTQRVRASINMSILKTGYAHHSVSSQNSAAVRHHALRGILARSERAEIA